ncbi:MAG: adenylate/guanylate cyclase domain-containing protein [Treponema sp.]|nr:adenylate/guanylate cyclase domain-containing protein [Treponema sp.]
MVVKKLKKIRKNTGAALIIAAAFLVVTVGDSAGVFEFLEGKAYDFRVRLLAGMSRPSDDIALILVDQDSIDWASREREWSWPWPRKAYAELIEYIGRGGARSLTFDIIFSEPSVYGPEDDAAFAEASARCGRVVQTVFFSTQWGGAFSWPEDLDKPLFNPVDFGEFLAGYELRGENRIGATFPIPALRNSAGVIGNITGAPDSDGVIRRAKPFVIFDGKAAPALSTASLLVSGMNGDITYNKRNETIQWESYTIPVDKDGAALLRFRGSLDRYIPYTAAELLQSAERYAQGREPILYPEDFEGKYVFIGYYAPGLFDICNTPIESVYPGMGIHITMLDNLLSRDFIRKIPRWGNALIILAAAASVGFLVFFAGRIPLAVGGGAAALILLGAAAVGAYRAGYWIPVAAPITGVIVVFLAATLYNYATEGSQRRFIKSAFSQYLSPAVIDRLVANPELLSLGGERREISIFFSDVQGFTSISEKLDPAMLTELLNDYLSFMTDTILDSGGTIDKYEGDAIIAFWNAPLNLTDHAARALRASMACQRKLADRQAFFEEKYGFRLLTRIGLNTGYAVVGNMGSSKRFDYTMLGDSVNLAARLEGLNKQFGTYLMCAENTFTQAAREAPFYGRKLALVAVVGKKEPVTVYEPLTEEEFRENAKIIDRFGAGRDLFYAGKFAAALEIFDALAATDKPSFYYTEQCRRYLEHPEDWKGFWQAASK